MSEEREPNAAAEPDPEPEGDSGRIETLPADWRPSAAVVEMAWNAVHTVPPSFVIGRGDDGKRALVRQHLVSFPRPDGATEQDISDANVLMVISLGTLGLAHHAGEEGAKEPWQVYEREREAERELNEALRVVSERLEGERGPYDLKNGEENYEPGDDEEGRRLKDLARALETAQQAMHRASIAWYLARQGIPIPTLPKPRPKPAPRPTPLPAVARFPCDNAHRSTIHALSIAPNWETGIPGMARGVQTHSKNVDICVGLPGETPEPSIWAVLCKGGAPLVKADLALKARWFENGGEATGRVLMDVNQFCEDIGYTKAKKGGYKAEHKRQAMELLKVLTSINIQVTFVPNGQAKARRLRGPLWERGLVEEESDQYADLYGTAREGDPNLWEPTRFTFSPGEWFRDPEWRRQNRFVGKVATKLLKLPVNTDEWAILIGGYLASTARIAAYKPVTLKAGTILTQTGLAQSEDAKRRKGRNQERFEAALDKLKAVGVISEWKWRDVDTTDVDLDDPDALAEYGAADPYPPGDWRNWIVVFTFPFDEDAARLAQGRRKALEAGKRRKAARKTRNAEATPET